MLTFLGLSRHPKCLQCNDKADHTSHETTDDLCGALCRGRVGGRAGRRGTGPRGSAAAATAAGRRGRRGGGALGEGAGHAHRGRGVGGDRGLDAEQGLGERGSGGSGAGAGTGHGGRGHGRGAEGQLAGREARADVVAGLQGLAQLLGRALALQAGGHQGHQGRLGVLAALARRVAGLAVDLGEGVGEAGNLFGGGKKQEVSLSSG